MIWIIAGMIVGLVYGIVLGCDFADSLIGRIFAIPLAGVFMTGVGGFCGLVISGFLGIGGAFLPHQDFVIEKPIYSVNDSVGTNGRFTLGTGYVDSDLCFFYITETGEGKVVEKSKREKTLIVETDTKNPSAKVVGKRLKWEWLVWVMEDWNTLGDKTVLTVPVGTTTTAYSIDLS